MSPSLLRCPQCMSAWRLPFYPPRPSLLPVTPSLPLPFTRLACILIQEHKKIRKLHEPSWSTQGNSCAPNTYHLFSPSIYVSNLFLKISTVFALTIYLLSMFHSSITLLVNQVFSIYFLNLNKSILKQLFCVLTYSLSLFISLNLWAADHDSPTLLNSFFLRSNYLFLLRLGYIYFLCLTTWIVLQLLILSSIFLLTAYSCILLNSYCKTKALYSEHIYKCCYFFSRIQIVNVDNEK